MNLKSLCSKYNVDVQGVIQVGASTGQELYEFLFLNPKRILMIEPIPQCVKELRDRAKDYPHITVVEKAITNFNGTASFAVTNNLWSSSLLPLYLHKTEFPSIKKTKEIKVVCSKLDSLLQELTLRPSDFNLLYVDVQGAELLVLKGATEVLTHIEAIHIEANYKELYKGCVLEPDLTKFLQDKGFKKMEMSIRKFQQNNILYVRMH